MALLAGAFPSADVAQLEAALTQSAHDLGVAGEDNSYGYGIADVQAAYQVLLAGAGTGNAPAITSTPPTSATEGSPIAISSPPVMQMAMSSVIPRRGAGRHEHQCVQRLNRLDAQ